MSFDENLINNPSKGMPRLQEIMRALRDPENGCPWDIEQNFKTIAPYTIEEAYEVADAIEKAVPEYNSILPGKVEKAFEQEELFSILPENYDEIKTFILTRAL